MPAIPSRLWCTDSPGFGGAELTLVRVLGMAGSERDEVLCAERPAPELIRRLEKSGFRFRRVFRGGNRLGALFGGLRTAFHCRREYPGALFIVWCHHLDSNRWLQLALALTRARFIVAERLIPADAESFAHSRLTVPLKRFVARRARYIVVNGPSQVEHYAALFGIDTSRIRAISNSRPVRTIHERVTELRRDRGALRRNLGLSEEGPVILCLGRLSDQKGQALLLQALPKVRREHPGAQLVLVGEGERRSDYEEQARELPAGAVVFAGHCDDVLPYLAAADVFVLPSTTEGLPGALIEAMAAELPCLATHIPGNRDLLLPGVTGLAFPVGDLPALVTALCELLGNRAAAKEYARAALDHVTASFDEAAEKTSWLSILAEC